MNNGEKSDSATQPGLPEFEVEEWNYGFNAGYESALIFVVNELKNGYFQTVEDATHHVRKMWIKSIRMIKHD